MIILSIEYTINDFFNLLYQKITENILNPDFEKSKFICPHNESIGKKNNALYCPICNNNTINIPPKLIVKERYEANDMHKKYFMENKFPLQSGSKIGIIREMLLKMYNKGNPCIYINNNVNSPAQKFKLTANGKEGPDNNTIIYFSGNFYRCNSCYPSFENWVANLNINKLNIYFYIKCCNLPKLDLENLTNHLKYLQFFYTIGLNNAKYIELNNFHHKGCSTKTEKE